MSFFTGGIHPRYNKLTKKSKIEVAPLPKRVVIPLNQHTGKAAEPIVAVMP